MYPPALVEWFSVLADNMRTASSCAGNDVLSILRLLKSNERLREGCAQEIAFRCGQPPPARRVRIVLSYDGFSVGEMTCAEETVAAFDWRDVECGIRRTYIENADHRREEVGERRGTCDLVSCLAGLDLGVLAASVCEVRELCEYKVIRSDGELRQKLLECLLGKAVPCRLRIRDGAVDIRLVASPGRQEDQEEIEVTATNVQTGDGQTYPTLSALLSAVPPGLYNKGLRLCPDGSVVS